MKRSIFIFVLITLMSIVLYGGFKISALNWQWWVIQVPYSLLSGLAYDWVFPNHEAS